MDTCFPLLHPKAPAATWTGQRGARHQTMTCVRPDGRTGEGASGHGPGGRSGRTGLAPTQETGQGAPWRWTAEELTVETDCKQGLAKREN